MYRLNNSDRLSNSTKVRIKNSHGAPHLRGKIGTIIKYIPWHKYWIATSDDVYLVDAADLELAP